MTRFEPDPPLHAATVYAVELAALDRLVEREILRLRAHYELSLDELRGLYISDRQVDALVRERGPAESPSDPVHRLTVEARTMRLLRRPDLPLSLLARRFGLSPVETDVLLLALAPELDLKYETLYAYLNNDITRKQLTADLARRLLRDDDDAHIALDGTLFREGLCEALDAGEGRSTLASSIVLTPAARCCLLGLDIADPRLPDGVRLLAHSADTSAGLSAAARDTVDRFGQRYRPQAGLLVCRGETAAEQLAAIRRHAGHDGRPLITLPLPVLAREPDWARLRDRVRTLARLTDAVVTIHDELDGFPGEPVPLLQLARQVRDLVAMRLPVAWAVPDGAPWATAVTDLPFVELVLPADESEARAATWHEVLARQGVQADAAAIGILAERFSLPCSRIGAAAQAALALDDCAAPEQLQAALWRSARRHSGQSLAQLANRIVKPHTWKQLVLPEATLRQVEEVAASIAQREIVFRRWRMAERTGRGNGLMAMFAGASGTGKTMTAAVIANDLGLDLYSIDLASVVSKYIGETEKNLDRIFQAARRSNAMLFFDEADALLGKRSEVKDAHDRYANIEVAYLLQKMEEHDGVVILASNMAKNLDQAFARRMHYVVEFPRPDAPMRERLWRGMFPPQAPLADDVDFGFLAEQFDTSGGEIQTVALDAAFLASAAGEPIGMAQLVRAMARQQLKQGNPASMSRFRQYHALARSG